MFLIKIVNDKTGDEVEGHYGFLVVLVSSLRSVCIIPGEVDEKVVRDVACS